MTFQCFLSAAWTDRKYKNKHVVSSAGCVDIHTYYYYLVINVKKSFRLQIDLFKINIYHKRLLEIQNVATAFVRRLLRCQQSKYKLHRFIVKLLIISYLEFK